MKSISIEFLMSVYHKFALNTRSILQISNVRTVVIFDNLVTIVRVLYVPSHVGLSIAVRILCNVHNHSWSRSTNTANLIFYWQA
jgi:hypothetical protein